MNIKTQSGLFKVSTVDVFDRTVDVYETGLFLGEHVKIVEAYPTREKAEQGHAKWVVKAELMDEQDFNTTEDIIVRGDYPSDLVDALKEMLGLD